MAKAGSRDVLEKGDEVVAAAELPRVPAGTKGKVVLVNGLSWIRYWVRFENGMAVGSVNRSKLATPDEWKRRDEVGDEDGAAVAGSEAASDGGAADDGGGVAVNGVVVPSKLIERSKAARERLGA